ncbi:Thiamin-phosphate pyrophosphorylase [Desulfosporosinus sp. BG]|nr:Thiamin-phosphate pyrophosphorylase [Desulfosporosinus sp. BG]
MKGMPRQKMDELDPAKKRTLPAGIYALTSEPHSLGRSNLEVAGEILAAGVPILQYREKSKKVRVMYEECLVLRAMTHQAGALFVINDHIDLALAVGADGVHIGQDDLPLYKVRELVGPNFLIGVSTHSPAQAQAAVKDGADYIGVGPIFATQTKVDVCDPVGLDYLDYVVKNLEIPFVAIGGIKEHNLAEVVKAGAQTVALVTEIVGNSDIPGKIKSLQRIMET